MIAIARLAATLAIDTFGRQGAGMTIGDDLRDILGAEDGETLVEAARRVAASRATYAAQRVSTRRRRGRRCE